MWRVCLCVHAYVWVCALVKIDDMGMKDNEGNVILID